MYISIMEEAKKELRALCEASKRLDEAFSELLEERKVEKEGWELAWTSFASEDDSRKVMIG